MSNRKAKVMRKEIRKTVKDGIGDGMTLLSKIVRKRPRWIPKSIWIWVYVPLFPRKYRHIIYKYLD